MIFDETALDGVWVIEPERLEDERGFFARTWDADEFAERGLNAALVQCSISFNRARGTLRGLHYQAAPHEEAKLVRCTAGAIFDVARRPPAGLADLPRVVRRRAVGGEPARALRPGGLRARLPDARPTTPRSHYQISEFYAPSAARGVRWDDPAFGIEWPGEVVVINERDRTYPDFREQAARA